MSGRAFERISLNIKVNFSCCGINYNGTVTNISENGMLIRTYEMIFPFHSEFELVLPLEEEVLNLPVKVSRLIKTGDIYNEIGIVILNPTNQYLKFINNLRSVL